MTLIVPFIRHGLAEAQRSATGFIVRKRFDTFMTDRLPRGIKVHVQLEHAHLEIPTVRGDFSFPESLCRRLSDKMVHSELTRCSVFVDAHLFFVRDFIQIVGSDAQVTMILVPQCDAVQVVLQQRETVESLLSSEVFHDATHSLLARL